MVIALFYDKVTKIQCVHIALGIFLSGIIPCLRSFKSVEPLGILTIVSLYSCIYFSVTVGVKVKGYLVFVPCLYMQSSVTELQIIGSVACGRSYDRCLERSVRKFKYLTRRKLLHRMPRKRDLIVKVAHSDYAGAV